MEREFQLRPARILFLKTEPKGASGTRRIPSLGVRAACWFGIYVGSQLPLYFGGLLPWNQLLALMWWFPLGMLGLGMFQNSGLLRPPFGDLAFFGVYVFYLCHLGLSAFWPTRRGFIFLMVVLIGASALSLVGCVETVGYLKKHPPLFDYSDVDGTP